MGKPRTDAAAARESWIQQRLGERKYRQLQMHLTGALRLLGELAASDSTESTQADDSGAQDVTDTTTKAVTDLTQRLRELSPKQQPIRIHNLRAVKSKRRQRTQRHR